MSETGRMAEVGRLADLYDAEAPVTETERWVIQTCERIVASGHVRLYKDLYKDLREVWPCGVACRLIADGLHATRLRGYSPVWVGAVGVSLWRARAIAALKRLERYATAKAADTWLTPDGTCVWEV